MLEKLSAIVFIFILVQVTTGQGVNSPSNNAFCSNFDGSCSSCIQNAQCYWCSDLGDHHCFSNSNTDKSKCRTPENPQNQVRTTKDEAFSETEGDFIQFKPQELKLSLRPGRPQNITVRFRQIPDYPLDLYYLMDLSYSMEIHKAALADVGEALANTMKKLTTQFKIGFGSFVDKVLLPYVDISPSALENPCTGGRLCAPPFSFINNVPLTEDATKFKKEVSAARLSGNVDSPEGGFDALMQAMVCHKEIGWRNQVRKIIVFSTDAQFHAAGDGKLGGVIEPNDGKCHMDGGRSYEKYADYDYPSVSHINEIAKQEGVNIIFAVVSPQKELYKQLAAAIDGASHATLSSNDSSRIITIIEEVYNSISGKINVEERSSTHENLFSTLFFSNCPNLESSGKFLTCGNIKEGETFDVTIQIELKGCPERETDREAQIVFGTKEETVTVNIEMLCDCGCKKDVEEPAVDECENHGFIECGICKCHSGFYGDSCQCMKNSTSVGSENTSKCRPEDDLNGLLCSGKGACLCEKCECRQNFYGTYCQWNGAKCKEREDAESCSGNGRCEAETCICDYDWDGEFCEYKHKRACIAKGDTVPCSNNGECIKGKCSCQIKDDIIYTGEFCEDCKSCGSGKCGVFRPCVQCKQWPSGIADEQCLKDCKDFHYQSLESLDDVIEDGARPCTFKDDNTNCYFNFTYKYISPGNYQIYTQRTQKCYEVDVLAAVFGVIGSIVVLGILTLILWKVITTIHDRREYSRFMSELDNQKWATNDNKIYVPPTTNVANPAYMK